MMDGMDRLVTPGSVWYVISMEWFQKWQNYTFYDFLDGVP